ncbi:MAG: DUF3179 domain-containing protein [Planctomycetes bacterium]|nr:DUF3179 domain-containing protein [Planctomycetota bacterium]
MANRILAVICCVVIAAAAVQIGGALYQLSQAEPVNNNQRVQPISGGSASFDLGRNSPFDPNDYAPMIAISKVFPAITDIPIKRSDEIDDEVRDDELVLGVEVNGEARAYPINQLTGPSREILNDVLGDTPLAATW